MTQIPYRAPETDALVTWLTVQAGAPVLRGLMDPLIDRVGWQGAPGLSDFVGYHVVNPLEGGQLDGDIANPSNDADRLWQVTSWGADAHHAEVLADQVLGVLVGQRPQLDIPGRALKWVRLDVPHGSGRQDRDEPSLWSAFGRYRIATTPLT